MEGRGGCCIARCSNGGVYDMSKVDRIMLRFRPIAPKPVTGGPVSGGDPSPPESREQVSPKTGRAKRKYNRETKSCNKKTSNGVRKRKASSEEMESTRKTSSGDSVVTLPLLPETPPESKEESPAKEESQSPAWLSFGNEDNFEPFDGGHVSVDLDWKTVMVPQRLRAAISVVTVECVTDTWLDVNRLGCNDHERMVSLARDVCPGFISDGFDRVLWSNRAYGGMVGKEGGEVIVWLVVKERVPITCNAFSCRARVQSTCRKEKVAMMVPCDVWRMDGGGLAWRLDVEAALCLGR